MRLFSKRNQHRSEEKGIAFVHIPKTAGTWFTTFLSRHFPLNALAPALYGHSAGSDFMDGSRRLFCGHFIYAHVREASGRLLLMTFLRDPVQRTISQYRSFHNPNNLTQRWRDTLSPEETAAIEWCHSASFDSFVRSDNPMIVGHISNVQTRHLSSFPSEELPGFLDTAIENLRDRFFFFGVQELSQSSIALFRFQTGSTLQWNPTADERNESRHYDASLSRAGQERLDELIRYDRELYMAGKQIFEDRIARALMQAA